MKFTTGRALSAAMIASLALAAQAGAHVHIEPEEVGTEHSEILTLVVPTEKASNTTTVEMEVPEGFNVSSFEPIPGVKRDVVATGEGEEQVISKVTWTGLKIGEGEAAYIRFRGGSEGAGSYAFKVRQTYADGEIVEWTEESEDAEFPAALVEVGEGGHDEAGGDDHDDMLLPIIALIVGGLGLVAGIVALSRGGKRSLT